MLANPQEVRTQKPERQWVNLLLKQEKTKGSSTCFLQPNICSTQANHAEAKFDSAWCGAAAEGEWAGRLAAWLCPKGGGVLVPVTGLARAPRWGSASAPRVPPPIANAPTPDVALLCDPIVSNIFIREVGLFAPLI